MKKSKLSTDAVAMKMANALLQDLELDSQYIGNPRTWEVSHCPLDPWDFKRHAQAESFLKKYIFAFEDVEKVREETKDKFIEIQNSLQAHQYVLTGITPSVVSYARGWLQEVLKEYDQEEHLSLCYFPKKASTGSPRSKSTLAHKWGDGLTGSAYHCEWFERIYKPFHSHCVGSQAVGSPTVVDALQANFVPKRWNKLRMIVPNSAIGGLYTNGLGRVLEKRLRAAGYCIRTLPERHKVLAQEASVTGKLATVDQSSASDNLTPRLAELLLPRRWCSVVLKGRVEKIDIGRDSPIHCETLSTMGIGYTFPLQTLIFLSLAYGLREEFLSHKGSRLGCRTISCFGDDLILPSELQGGLEHVFGELHLKLNIEKTFFTGPFRESCGGDYFRGIDVRPSFLPEGGSSMSTPEYKSFLYRAFNALRLRWHTYEIRRVLDVILCELRTLTGKLHVVPPSHGDDSGLKVELWEFPLFELELPARDIHGTYTFWALVKKPTTKVMVDDECYYWYSLQHSGHVNYCPPKRLPRRLDAAFARCVLADTDFTPAARTTRVCEVQPKNYRSKLTGRKLVKVYSEVSLPGDDGVYGSLSSTSFSW